LRGRPSRGTFPIGWPTLGYSISGPLQLGIEQWLQAIFQDRSHDSSSDGREMHHVREVFWPMRHLLVSINQWDVLFGCGLADPVIHALLHVKEAFFLEHGIDFAPSGERHVVAFREWLRKHGGVREQDRFHSVRAQGSDKFVEILPKTLHTIFRHPLPLKAVEALSPRDFHSRMKGRLTREMAYN